MFVTEKRRFLAAGLFGGLAILAVVFVFTAPRHPEALHSPGTVIVFHPSLKEMQMLATIVAVLSALAYFAFGRWSTHSLNRSLALVHFALLALGVFLIEFSVTSFGKSSLW